MPDDFFKKLQKFGKINFGIDKVHYCHNYFQNPGMPQFSNGNTSLILVSEPDPEPFFTTPSEKT
jgi:hypothetical protein